MDRHTRRYIFDAVVWIAGVAMVAVLAVDAAASERRAFNAANPTWRNECGSCHIAYPPQLLAGPSLQTIMQGLDRHFGTRASLDAATSASILAFLEANTDPDEGERGSAGATRITETHWFRHEHAQIAQAVWNRPEVRSRSKCGACHGDADRGKFSEHAARMPRQRETA